MIEGTPYFGDENIRIYKEILESEITYRKDVYLYALVKDLKKHTKVIRINNRFLTWLEDIRFNYKDKVVEIPYYSYNTIKIDHKINPNRKEAAHILVDNDGKAIIKYEFSLEVLKLNLGDKIEIFDLSDNTLTEYHIINWIDEEFSIERLYNLYKQYCYYDLYTEFSGHDSGYTFIVKQSNRFNNLEHKIRKSLKLKTWKTGNKKLDEYRDTRIYRYLEYLEKVDSSEVLSDEIFKYRRLAFESYLYCCLRSGKTPVDNKGDWDKLGETKYYIKISDGRIPLFIKCEWVDTNKLKNTVTWRK